MTCTHQWHDATTSAGSEWVCAKCKVTYSETKKAPPAKREWVGLTNEERVDLWKATETDNRMVLIDATESKLMEKNT